MRFHDKKKCKDKMDLAMVLKSLNHKKALDNAILLIGATNSIELLCISLLTFTSFTGGGEYSIWVIF